MNNEEKIISILGQMQEDLSGLKNDVAVLKEGQAALKDDVAVLKEDVAVLKDDVAINRSMLARVEIEHGKKLQALVDAQVGYEETYKWREPRIVKLEQEVELLNIQVRSLQIAK